MDCFPKLVILAALAFAGAANAAYTNLPPPPGFGGAPGAWTFAPSTADDVIGKVMRQSKSLPVPGTSATMGVAYKLGPTASKVAAAALYLNPYVRTAAGIASWLTIGKVLYDAATDQWMQVRDGIDITCGPGPLNHTSAMAPYQGSGPYGNPHQVSVLVRKNASGQCELIVIQKAQQWGYAWRTVEIFAASWAPISTDTAVTVPVTKEEFERILAPEVWTPGAPSTMPESVPKELPKPTPLPVELPVVNPTPGQNPTPQPKFVPTGEPVPNPKYDPQQAPSETNKPYLQPGVRVTPKPTPAEPWRVEYMPVDRPQVSPEVLPDAEQPGTDSKDKPKVDEQISLCEKHPDIIACQKFDEPKSDDLPTRDKDATITPDSGWGSETASCPAPKQITVQGRSIAIPYDLFCTYANGMRPIIIAMAWLSAAFILMGARSES